MAALAIWGLAWQAGHALAGEPIGGFSRAPVASYRTLSPREQDRLRAWNRAHPDDRLEPKRVSSLELHFLKHAAGGREFVQRGWLWTSPRFETARHYEEAARALASAPAGGRMVRRFRQPDGDIVTVGTTSGHVVIVAPTGRIRSFFNAAARCSGREPAVRCTTSLSRAARWVSRRTADGRLAEIAYDSDPLSGAQPLTSPPLPGQSTKDQP